MADEAVKTLWYGVQCLCGRDAWTRADSPQDAQVRFEKAGWRFDDSDEEWLGGEGDGGETEHLNHADCPKCSAEIDIDNVR